MNIIEPKVEAKGFARLEVGDIFISDRSTYILKQENGKYIFKGFTTNTGANGYWDTLESMTENFIKRYGGTDFGVATFFGWEYKLYRASKYDLQIVPKGSDH